MVIAGEWKLGDDGGVRPLVHTRVIRADGVAIHEPFLIDSGADRSVFAGPFFNRLDMPGQPPPPDMELVGIGGSCPFALVSTTLELFAMDGKIARVRGPFLALLEPSATDLSVLGRDVTSKFDLILSRRRGEVLLLANECRYEVTQ